MSKPVGFNETIHPYHVLVAMNNELHLNDLLETGTSERPWEDISGYLEMRNRNRVVRSYYPNPVEREIVRLFEQEGLKYRPIEEDMLCEAFSRLNVSNTPIRRHSRLPEGYSIRLPKVVTREGVDQRKMARDFQSMINKTNQPLDNAREVPIVKKQWKLDKALYQQKS